MEMQSKLHVEFDEELQGTYSVEDGEPFRRVTRIVPSVNGLSLKGIQFADAIV